MKSKSWTRNSKTSAAAPAAGRNMPRAKKDGKFLNCYINKEILEKLEQYCEKTSIPKTSVVEKALSQYLMQFEALMDKKK